MFDFLKSPRKFSANTHFLNGHHHIDDDGTRYICLYLFDRNLTGQDQLDDAFNVGNMTFPEWETMSEDEFLFDVRQQFKKILNLLNCESNQDWSRKSVA